MRLSEQDLIHTLYGCHHCIIACYLYLDSKLFFTSLPVYMWRKKIEAEGKTPFFELLQMIGARRTSLPELVQEPIIDQDFPADISDIVEEEGDTDYETATSTEICAFCGLSCTNRHVMDKHIQYCPIRLTFK